MTAGDRLILGMTGAQLAGRLAGVVVELSVFSIHATPPSG
jgi:hypothetical protein